MLRFLNKTKQTSWLKDCLIVIVFDFLMITEVSGFGTESIIAFGDDFADIGMLELCGLGVAMGNAIEEIKEKADIVIGSNDEDGIAVFLENEMI